MDLVGNAAKALALARRVGEGFTEAIGSEEVRARVDRIKMDLGPYGVDPFGFDPQYLKKWIGIGAWVYRRYFRCSTRGVENIPDGRCFIIANHSGQLPFDGMMITMAGFLEREPPRFMRSMVERFVPATPFISPFLARCGQILGTPENCRRLLEKGEAIMVFPEGIRGLNKSFRDRYRLQRFGQGFMRLAIEMGVPIIPTTVIGAEEQAPSLYNAKALGSLLGMPALPLTVGAFGPLPMPVRYHIRFGEPMRFSGNANDEDQVIMDKVGEVRTAMQSMIDAGLAEREHIFW